MAEMSRSTRTGVQHTVANAEQMRWVGYGRDPSGRLAREQKIIEVQTALAEAFARIARRRF